MRASRSCFAALSAACLALSAARSTHAQPAEHGPTMMKMPPVQIQMTSDSVVVPMRIQDGRIVVEVMLDGKGPFPFLFDSGAHGSVMDLEFAKAQNLPLGGEVRVGSPGGPGRTGQFATVKQVSVGGLSVQGMMIVAFTGLPFKGPDAPRGVLSPYSLAGLLVRFDYPTSRVIFTRGALPQPDGREIFGWTAQQPLPVIPITVGGQKLDANVDTGARFALSLPESLAKTLPLAAPPVDAGRARTVDQDVAAKTARLKGSLTLGRYSLENPTLMFSALHVDVANVGPPLLRQFSLTLDPANRRLKLAGPANGKLIDAPAAPSKP
jgi:hypothetical protein